MLSRSRELGWRGELGFIQTLLHIVVSGGGISIVFVVDFLLCALQLCKCAPHSQATVSSVIDIIDKVGMREK